MDRLDAFGIFGKLGRQIDRVFGGSASTQVDHAIIIGIDLDSGECAQVGCLLRPRLDLSAASFGLKLLTRNQRGALH
jgi:hypothetical protein